MDALMKIEMSCKMSPPQSGVSVAVSLLDLPGPLLEALPQPLDGLRVLQLGVAQDLLVLPVLGVQLVLQHLLVVQVQLLRLLVLFPRNFQTDLG